MHTNECYATRAWHVQVVLNCKLKLLRMNINTCSIHGSWNEYVYTQIEYAITTQNAPNKTQNVMRYIYSYFFSNDIFSFRTCATNGTICSLCSVSDRLTMKRTMNVRAPTSTSWRPHQAYLQTTHCWTRTHSPSVPSVTSEISYKNLQGKWKRLIQPTRLNKTAKLSWVGRQLG